MSNSLKEKAFDSMQWTGTSSTYVSVLQIFQIAVLANFLSPAEIGTMTLLLLVVWFTQAFSDGGMSPAIVHFEKIHPGHLNSLFLLNIIYGVILYFVVNLLASPLVTLFDEPTLVEYLPVIGIVIVMSTISTQFRVILSKDLRFDLIARHEMASITISSIISITLAWQGFGVWSMVIGYLIGSFFSSVILVFYGLKYWKPGVVFKWSGLHPFVKFGQFQIGERVMIFLNSRIDQLLIGALIGTQALGIYTLAHNLVIGPTIRVNQIISTVMFPVFAKLQKEAESLRNGYIKLVMLVTMINTPILMGVALTAPLLIPILFGEEWFESIYILQILSVYALIRSTGSPAGSLQLAKGRADLGFKWNLGLMVVTVPYIYIGATLGGLPGIAWSQIALQLTVFVPYWIFMIRPMIGPPAKDYFYSIFDAVVPGFFMAAWVWLIWILSPALPSVLRLGIMATSGVALFVLFTYKVERELFDEIKSLVRNKYFKRP
jgi:lipopolysaccharide exporter